MPVLTVGGKLLLLAGTSLLAIAASNTQTQITPPPTLAPLALVVRGNVIQVGSTANDAFWPVYSGGVGPYTFAMQAGAGQTLSSGGTQLVTANGRSFFLSGTTGFCTASYAGTTPETVADTITLVITDSAGDTATATWTQAYTTGPTISLTQDFLQTNTTAGSGSFIGISPQLTGFTSAAVATYVEPSGLLTVQWNGVNGGYIFAANNTWPAPGIYPVTLTVTQGSLTHSQTFNIFIVANVGPTFIDFVKAALLSTSLPAGFVVGQANAGDLDNTYVWSVDSASAVYFAVSTTGQVSLVQAPATAGIYPITLICADRNAAYQQTFSVPFVAGVTIAASAMTVNIPSNLDNSVSSGTLSTPSVTGFTPTLWLLQGKYGVGTRYTINAATGVTSIIGPLSYQVAADGADFSDVLTWIATDGINTCSLTQEIPVAAAVGPTIYIGPPAVLAAANLPAGAVTYPTLTAAFDALGAQEPEASISIAAGTVFCVYAGPAGYYLQDGINLDHGIGAGGIATMHVPITIMGAPGTTFPQFTGGGCGKGYFGGLNYDLTLLNLEICNVTQGDGTSNFAGVYKEAGSSTGNITIDNCYIHDCDNGIARGCPGSKLFITGTRVTYCGIGSFGLTHNIYVEADLVYANNILSDTCFIGHLFKTRSQNTIIEYSSLIDGHLGCASNIIDIPMGGTSTVGNNIMTKGPNGQNPFMLKYADPDDQGPQGAAFNRPGQINVLSVVGNTLLLDPGEPGLGNVMPGMNTSNASQAEVFGICNASFPGAANGVPAAITGSSNIFLGLASGNQTLITSTQGGIAIPAGTIALSSSTTLTQEFRPDWDLTFPGEGPDPTIASPPGPFLTTWLGGPGGGQITGPLDVLSVAEGELTGSIVGTVTWSQGNTAIANPAFALNYQSGPNSFSINANTGVVTLAATAVTQPGAADVIGVTVSGGGEEYIWNLVVAVTGAAARASGTANYPPVIIAQPFADIGNEQQVFLNGLKNQTILAGTSFTITSIDAINNGDFSEVSEKIGYVPSNFGLRICMPASNLSLTGTYPFATRQITVGYQNALHLMNCPVLSDPNLVPWLAQCWGKLVNWLTAEGYWPRVYACGLTISAETPYDEEQTVPSSNGETATQAMANWNALGVTETSAIAALTSLATTLAGSTLTGKTIVLPRLNPGLTMVGHKADGGKSYKTLGLAMQAACAAVGATYSVFDQTILTGRRAVVDRTTNAVGTFAGELDPSNRTQAETLAAYNNALANPNVQFIELQGFQVPFIQSLIYPPSS